MEEEENIGKQMVQWRWCQSVMQLRHSILSLPTLATISSSNHLTATAEYSAGQKHITKG